MSGETAVLTPRERAYALQRTRLEQACDELMTAVHEGPTDEDVRWKISGWLSSMYTLGEAAAESFGYTDLRTKADALVAALEAAITIFELSHDDICAAWREPEDRPCSTANCSVSTALDQARAALAAYRSEP